MNRGGAYNDFGKHLRSAYRSATNPLDHDQNLGFRVARNDDKSLVEPAVTELSRSVETTIIETKYDSKIGSIVIPKNPKILISYFSYSGNTESAAKYISKVLKAKYGEANVDLVEIEMVNPYRGGIYEVTQKDLNAEARPPLKTRIADMKKYDVILLSSTAWVLMVLMTLMAVSSVFATGAVFEWSSLRFTQFWRTVHLMSTSWAYMIMSFHLALHVHSPLKKLDGKAAAQKCSILPYVIYSLVILAGCFAFYKTQIYYYLFNIGNWKMAAPNIVVSCLEYMGITTGVISVYHLIRH